MSNFLTYEDRLIIAHMLEEQASFGEIGNTIGKDRTTVAKEIKKYSYDKKVGKPGYLMILATSGQRSYNIRTSIPEISGHGFL